MTSLRERMPTGRATQDYHQTVIDLSEAARANLQRAAAGVPLAEIALLLSGLSWFLRALTGDEAKVAVGLPFRPLRDAAATLEVVTVPIEVDPGTALRAHVETVRLAMVEALRHDRPEPGGAPPDVYLDSAAAHGEPAAPAALLRVRLLESGRIRVETPAALEEDWGRSVCASLVRYLEAMAEPDRTLGSIPLLGPEEQAHLRRLSTGRDAPDYRPEDFLRSFEATARDHAARPAVIGADRVATYGEVNGEANRLARHLQSAYRIGPGKVVGILLDNDVDAVTALLAVLKLGGIYMPIEPDWPETRIAEVMEIAGAAALITASGDFREALAHIPTFLVDLQLSLLDESPEDIAAPIEAEQSACLFFTSGSTGRPKGVLVAHAGLSNMLRDQVDFLGLGAQDRVLQPFSLAFDASLLSIGLALLAGGAVVPLARPLLGDIPAAAARLREAGVTVISFVPSILRRFAPEDLGAAHTVICGGEPLTPSDVVRYGAGRSLVNSYGATETTCCVAAQRLTPGDDIVLGGPIANSSLTVVNSEYALLPVGTVGEICVEGLAVAQGYVGGEPRRGFLPSPSHPGGRLYRTGDLGFWRADGRLQLVGRVDRQFKLNGQRIDPAEIEAALMTHPSVRAAHVLCEDGRLWGFAAGRDLPSGEILHGFLSGSLPHYMLPSRIVPLEAIAFGTTGKVDEAALRALIDRDRTESPEDAPATDWERRLLALWQEVLEREAIGVSANFFDLGGNSLLALQVLARIEKSHSRRIGLSDFFRSPTVRGLADLAERTHAAAATPIPDTIEEAILDLSPLQLGVWLDSQRHADDPAYNVTRVFAIEGMVDEDSLREAVIGLGRRHEALRTNFFTEGGRPRQRISSEPTAVLRVIDLSSTDLIAPLIGEIRAAPFRLESDPLLRVALIRAAGQTRLVVVVHHIVCDGWSMTLLLRELSALYQASADSLPPPAAPAVPHHRCIRWQIAEAETPAARAHLADWADLLAAARAKAVFPADHPPVPGPASNGALQHRFGPDRLDRVRRFAQARQSTPFQLALSALVCVLREESRDSRIAIGFPVSLRTRPELESQIGLFLNMLALRIDTTGAESALDVLDRTEKAVAWALERRDSPHVLVAGEVEHRSASPAAPLFDIEIDYRSATLQADPPILALGGALARRQPIERGQGRKFRMDFLFTETDGDLHLDVLYDSGLYDKSSVERIVGRVAALLAAVTEGENPVLAPLAAPADIALDARRKRLMRHIAAPAAADVAAGGGLTIHERRQDQTAADFLAELGHGLSTSSRAGAILYRGSGIGSAEEFRSILEQVNEPLVRYTERSSARREVSSLVYTSTEHPADQIIKLHTEHSYAASWPLRLIFCCIEPAERGGETPIASIQAMTARLRPEVLAPFRERGVLYVRNFGGGLGLDWPEVFGTTDRSAVEDHCRANGIAWSWWGAGRLTLRFRRPAFRHHPVTGQELWFNHAYFFHPASLDPSLLSGLRHHCAETDLPFQTFYGDGEPIADSVIAEIEAAYGAVEQLVRWQGGDVLILDNMQFAHGRRSFEGRRKVLVAMSRTVYPERESTLAVLEETV